VTSAAVGLVADLLEADKALTAMRGEFNKALRNMAIDG
jgi:hypothetical protein